MHPKAICFDLDETLVDETAYWEEMALTCKAVAASRPGLSAADLLAANKAAWNECWPRHREDWNLGKLNVETFSRDLWRRAFRLCGFDDEALAVEATPILLDYDRAAHRLFDDTPGVLAALAGHHQMALITNGAAALQREKLDVLDLARHFSSIVISAELGVVKPDAAIFHHALDKLGVRPEDAWHIGDSLATDVAGAKAAGLTAVWLNRRGTQRTANDPVPDHEIASLSDLLPLLGHEAT